MSDLIMGFRTATSGQVLLDGCEISDIKRSKLRSAIGMASQNPVIFEGTVYYNLSQTAADEDIERMSKGRIQGHVLIFLVCARYLFDRCRTEDLSADNL